MTSVKLDRNNTNFTLQLVEFFKTHTWGNNYDFLKYYQNITRIFAKDVDIDARGLLVTTEMGMGKSIIAISIAMDIIDVRQPIILLTKSLQQNMRQSIIKYVNLRSKYDPDYNLSKLSPEELNKWIDKKFSFVSMNASNMLKQMGKAAEGKATEELDSLLEKKFGEVLKFPTLDGKLLIVDEAHNLFRAITNGSKNAIGLYDMVMKSKNLKVMFFTGTPIANDPFELVPCFNMLGSKIPGKITLPENYRDFNKLFVDDKTGSIKNREKLQNRILGLVSHVSHSSTPGAGIGMDGTSTKIEIPDKLPMIIEKVQMTPEQYVIYQLARDKEKDEGNGGKSSRIVDAPNMTKPRSKEASSYRVKSRQLSNYCAPEKYRGIKDPAEIPLDKTSSPKFEQIYKNINKHKNQLGIVYSQFVGVGGLGTFMRYLQYHKWEQVKINTSVAKINKLEHSDPGEQGELDEYIPDSSENVENISREVIEEEVDEIVGSAEIGKDELEQNAIVKTILGDENMEYSGPFIPPVDNIIKNLDEELIKIPDNVWWIQGGKDSNNESNNGNNYKYKNKINYTAGDDAVENLNFSSEIFEYEGGRTVNDSVKKFAIISGDVDVEDRALLQDMLNSDNNKYGGIIDLILISSTGAEGLDLKNIRHIHIMEPYWNWGRISQIEARGVRNG